MRPQRHRHTPIHAHTHCSPHLLAKWSIAAHTHTHIHTHAHTHTHARNHIHTLQSSFSSRMIHSCTHTYTRTHTHIHTHVIIHTHCSPHFLAEWAIAATHIHTHTCKHTHTHTHEIIHTHCSPHLLAEWAIAAHTHTYTHAHTHTHARKQTHTLQSSFASRMSHSCTPNCQTIVVSAEGRLTIVMYALRHIEVSGNILTIGMWSRHLHVLTDFAIVICIFQMYALLCMPLLCMPRYILAFLLFLFALQPGEELTFDYSRCVCVCVGGRSCTFQCISVLNDDLPLFLINVESGFRCLHCSFFLLLFPADSSSPRLRSKLADLLSFQEATNTCGYCKDFSGIEVPIFVIIFTMVVVKRYCLIFAHCAHNLLAVHTICSLCTQFAHYAHNLLTVHTICSLCTQFAHCAHNFLWHLSTALLLNQPAAYLNGIDTIVCMCVIIDACV